MLIESVMAKAQMEELEQQSTSLSTAAKPANLRYTTYYLHPFISISNRETILVVAPKVFHQQLLPPLHCCQVRTILSVSRRQSNNEDSVIHPAAPAAVGRTWIQQRSSKLKLVGNKWLVSEGLCVCPAALLCQQTFHSLFKALAAIDGSIDVPSLSLFRVFSFFFFGRNLSRLSDLLGIHTQKERKLSTLRCFVLSLKSNLYTHRKMFSSSSSSFSFPHITLRLLNFLLL